MTKVNYFGALAAAGGTSLVLTPAQYRKDPTRQRHADQHGASYAGLDLRLFYTGDVNERGSQPAGAAAPRASARSRAPRPTGS